MPLFKTKRNTFNWIKNGQKTIDVRKGKAGEARLQLFNAAPTSYGYL
ncbi:MAG: hypothetical protein QXP36_01970 [Conexivisphaerales archaeon]